MRTITKNLRIREDTAKYLRNLDPNSAAYSGKSRTMNENPNPEKPDSLSTFKGDNMAKFSGEYLKYLNQEAFTLEASAAGVEVNHVAMPSQVEILHKQFKEKQEVLKNKKMQDLIGKYGGEKHLKIPDEFKQAIDPNDAEIINEIKSVEAREFAIPDAKIIPSKKLNTSGLTGVQSKYTEDVHENNHCSIWGSYWHSVLGWGYQCCFSFDRK